MNTGCRTWRSARMVPAFSPASWDQAVRVWDAKTGKVLLDVKGMMSYESSVAFSPDGKRIVAGRKDGTAPVINARTGAILLELKGHPHVANFVHIGAQGVLSVAFSPDGARIVTGGTTGGRTGEASVWDAHTGAELLELKGHTGLVIERGVQPRWRADHHRQFRWDGQGVGRADRDAPARTGRDPRRRGLCRLQPGRHVDCHRRGKPPRRRGHGLGCTDGNASVRAEGAQGVCQERGSQQGRHTDRHRRRGVRQAGRGDGLGRADRTGPLRAEGIKGYRGQPGVQPGRHADHHRRGQSIGRGPRKWIEGLGRADRDAVARPDPTGPRRHQDRRTGERGVQPRREAGRRRWGRARRPASARP